jgi:hypothetical protein
MGDGVGSRLNLQVATQRENPCRDHDHDDDDHHPPGTPLA